MLLECRSWCFQSSDQPLGLTSLDLTSCRPQIPNIRRFIYHRAFIDDAAFFSLNSTLQNPAAILADLASMLLSNLTSSSPACSVLLSMKVSVIPDTRLANGAYTTDSRCGSCPEPVPYPKGEVQEVTALPLLLEAFVQGASVHETQDLSKRTRKAELNFLANVFANMIVVCGVSSDLDVVLNPP